MNLHDIKRISIKPRNPNPLFKTWLSRWKDQAPSSQGVNFARALKSLEKYPLPLESGRECRILKGFNVKLCTMLDDHLNKYKANGNSEDENMLAIFTLDDGNKGKSSKSYVPKYRSGSYAILMALHIQNRLENYPGFLTKAEIIKYGKDLSDSSFTKPDPGSRYTAWTSMTTLISKHLVSKVGNPAKFSLTVEGKILAEKLFEQTNCLELEEKGKHLETKTEIHKGSALAGTNTPCNIIIDLEDDLYCEESKTEDFHVTDINRSLVNRVDSTRDNVSSQLNIKRSCKSPKQRILKRFASCDTDVPYSRANKNHKTGFAKALSANSIAPGRGLSAQNSVTSVNYQSSTSTKGNVEHFILMPHSFDVVLYVDKNETSGSLNLKNDNLLRELDKSDVKYEVKDLKVGDFTWVCRDRLNHNELVLPYIIERKRMDDFAQSIKDKRYYEQKFRLKKSGIENLTYLVESYGNNNNLCLPVESLRQASSNTAIQENFFIKFTNDYKETAEYLANFTNILERMFKSKTLASCDKDNILPMDINSDLISLMIFKEFNLSAMKSKKMTVSDLFVKMLIQIRGMSVERGLAIIQQYPTPYLLKEAYESNNSESANEQLLSNIKYSTRKKIGPALSKIVFRFFCKLQY